MCTQTDNIEVDAEPRDINTLLALDTYQGMTDEEIELIINYKVRQEIFSQEMLMKAAAQTEHMNAMAETNRQGCARALDMIESLIDRGLPQYPTPEMPEIELRITEV